VLQACECDARGRLSFADATYPQATRLLQAQQTTPTMHQPEQRNNRF